MNAFYGRILSIDLNRKEFYIEPLDAEVLAKCLGGKGLAANWLYHWQKK
ncbi:MAG: hypothetical protein R3274_12440 [Desulfobacterales bacterium]|nr:hypothetical protein [Desulfobacterales bacterium]